MFRFSDADSDMPELVEFASFSEIFSLLLDAFALFFLSLAANAMLSSKLTAANVKVPARKIATIYSIRLFFISTSRY